MATAKNNKKAKTPPHRVALVTWVSPNKKKAIDSYAEKKGFASTGAFVRKAIDRVLTK